MTIFALIYNVLFLWKLHSQPLKRLFMSGVFLGGYIYLRLCPFDWSEK